MAARAQSRTSAPAGDIIFEIAAEWSVELEPEVERWLELLTPKLFGAVAFQLDRLATSGSSLRMPLSRSLDGGLFELRFDLDRRRFGSRLTSPRAGASCC